MKKALHTIKSTWYDEYIVLYNTFRNQIWIVGWIVWLSYLYIFLFEYGELQHEKNVVHPIKNNDKTLHPMNAQFPMEHASSFQSKSFFIYLTLWRVQCNFFFRFQGWWPWKRLRVRWKQLHWLQDAGNSFDSAFRVWMSFKRVSALNVSTMVF